MAVSDWGEVREALPAPPVVSTRIEHQQQPASLSILLWNINGKSGAGMTAARKMLVGKVVERRNPDVMLFQEIDAAQTTISELPRMYTYAVYKSGRQRPIEAAIIINTNVVTFVASINLEDVIGDKKLFSPESMDRSTRQVQNPDGAYYHERACAIRLRHITTGMEFVVMSFHNASTRTGGKKSEVVKKAIGFQKLVGLVQEGQKVPVISGGDFNCKFDRVGDSFKVPLYASSVRRRNKDQIDLFVIKDSTSISVTSEVEVHEALPLVDPYSASEAEVHFLGKYMLRYLVENAPVKTTGPEKGTKVTREEYNSAMDHDPTCNTVMIYHSRSQP